MRRSTRGRTASITATAAALVLGLAAGPAVAAPPADRGNAQGKGPAQAAEQGNGRFQPGAAGIGDPYFPLAGNGGYDVAHYLLDVSYDPATDVLEGVATITATALQDLSRFNLDLVGLTVESVSVDGKPARASRSDDHELVITPRGKLKAGQSFVVVVEYSGVPTTFRLPINPEVTLESGFIHTDDGALVVGQPESATAWFPVNDHPADAASYTFVVTVPTGLEVVANGVPVGAPVTTGATTTWTWEAREPMASYLTGLGIGQFDVDDRTEDGLRVIDALDPDLPADVRERIEESFGRQVELLALLEEWFGPYPYDTVGGIVDDYPIFFALETQTRPIYSFLFWDAFEDADESQLFGTQVVVHELAHQWFGDDLRLERWQDIWLNEGFATYAEWLFLEDEDVSTPQEEFMARYEGFDEDFWGLTIGDPGPERLFDGPVYDRGGMTLHALRVTIGDDDFFTLLRRWAAEQAGQTVTTEEFIALAEQVSGEQLDGLFDEWLFQADRPPLPIALDEAASGTGGPAPPPLACRP